MDFFNNYSYRKKNYILIGVFILILFVSYKHQFKNTIDLFFEIKKLNEKNQHSKENEILLRKLQSEVYLLNKHLGLKQLKKSIEYDFIQFLISNSENIKIETLSEPLIFQNNDFKINNYIFNLSGDYFDLISLIYKLELYFNNARIVSISFSSKEKGENKKLLFATIYLQNYSI